MSWYWYAAIAAYKAVDAAEGVSGAIDQADEQKRAGYAVSNANEDRVRRRAVQALGRQRAAAVQSGFQANSGSLAELQGESSGNLELDALTARYAGQVNAWRTDQQKMNARAAVWQFGMGAGAQTAASAYSDYASGTWANSGNSYYGANGQRYANNDLSGTNRGSGD